MTSPASFDHVVALGHRRDGEVDVRERQAPLLHRPHEVELGVGRRAGLVEQLEQESGPRVAVAVDAVAEARDELVVAQTPADGLRRRDAALDLAEDASGGRARGAVERAAERGQAGLDDQVRVGPRRRGDPGGQRRRGQLVVGEEHERGLEQSHPRGIGGLRR